MKNGNGFRISGLSMDPFFHLLTLSDAKLASHQARRYKADSKPGFPCRVSLVDAEPGETVILLPYLHHAVNGPYRSSGPIFVRENARPAELGINELPEVVKNRLMSVRAYDSESLMLASVVVEGPETAIQIEEFFADERVGYLHLHNAKPGCYSCRADRA